MNQRGPIVSGELDSEMSMVLEREGSVFQC
jgi:hypothetical protein